MESEQHFSNNAPSAKKKRTTKLTPVLEYFELEGNIAKCRLCSKSLQSVTNSNLKRHIILNHLEVAENNGWTTDKQKSGEIISYKMNKMDVKKNLVKFFTEDNQPFSVLSKQSFRDLI